VIEWVPSYTAVTVLYHPAEVTYQRLVQSLERLAEQLDEEPLPQPRIISLPVCYGGEYGPDLEALAELCGKTPEEVIRIHSTAEYVVYMMGFAPGFPYLGGLPNEIAAPRLATPRSLVPAGSVGIAGEQTGVYPIATPGGWRIIGRTPIPLYDPTRNPPVLLKAGDRLRFRPINQTEYLKIADAVKNGEDVWNVGEWLTDKT
jgi:inhibitor of KinA